MNEQPRRLTDEAPAHPGAARAAELLRRLQPPPRFAAAASERLEQKILGGAAPARRGRWALLALPALAAGLTAVIALPARRHDEGFRSRGPAPAAAPAAANELQVFRIGGGRAEPLDGALRRDDELAFAYRSDGLARRLLVFGRDEHGHVYWYHPAWTDPGQDPEAVPLAREPGVHELPAAIAHALDGRTLELCWLFTAEPLRARQVEARLAAGELSPACRTLEVKP